MDAPKRDEALARRVTRLEAQVAALREQLALLRAADRVSPTVVHHYPTRQFIIDTIRDELTQWLKHSNSTN